MQPFIVISLVLSLLLMPYSSAEATAARAMSHHSAGHAAAAHHEPQARLHTAHHATQTTTESAKHSADHCAHDAAATAADAERCCGSSQSSLNQSSVGDSSVEESSVKECSMSECSMGQCPAGCNHCSAQGHSCAAMVSMATDASSGPPPELFEFNPQHYSFTALQPTPPPNIA